MRQAITGTNSIKKKDKYVNLLKTLSLRRTVIMGFEMKGSTICHSWKPESGLIPYRVEQGGTAKTLILYVSLPWDRLTLSGSTPYGVIAEFTLQFLNGEKKLYGGNPGNWYAGPLFSFYQMSYLLAGLPWHT